MKRKIIGYAVVEFCDDYEQYLGLRTGDDVPNEGILVFTDGRRFVFKTYKKAREGITRTEHYRLAFNHEGLPCAKDCKVVTLETLE